MKDEDYELLPHEELERLRREIDHLKKNPYSDAKENRNLLDTMDALNTSIKKLIAILEDAQEDLIKEYSEASPSKLLREISAQNAKIAEGILAVSKMVQKSDSPTTTPKTPPPRTQSTKAFSPKTTPNKSYRDLSAFKK